MSVCYNPRMTAIVVVRPFLGRARKTAGLCDFGRGSISALSVKCTWIFYIYKEENHYNECTG